MEQNQNQESRLQVTITDLVSGELVYDKVVTNVDAVMDAGDQTALLMHGSYKSIDALSYIKQHQNAINHYRAIPQVKMLEKLVALASNSPGAESATPDFADFLRSQIGKED